MEIKQKALVVIGGGIGSLMPLYYLLDSIKSKSLKHEIRQITLFDGHKIIPSASYQSSAVAAMRGAFESSDPSDYARDICDSFQSLQLFYDFHTQEKNLSELEIGISKGSLQDLDKDRQESCFLFTPSIFLPWLKSSIAALAKELGIFFEIKLQMVSYLQRSEFSKQEDLLVFMGLGAYEDNTMIEGSVVRGTYLSCFNANTVNPLTSSVVFQSERKSMSYNAITQTWKIGVLSAEHLSFFPDLQNLRVLYDFWKQKLPAHQLPPLSEWDVHTGLRHKISRKKPRFKVNAEKNVVHFFGLYKNGYLFPFLDAKKALDVLTQS